MLKILVAIIVLAATAVGNIALARRFSWPLPQALDVILFSVVIGFEPSSGDRTAVRRSAVTLTFLAAVWWSLQTADFTRIAAGFFTGTALGSWIRLARTSPPSGRDRRHGRAQLIATLRRIIGLRAREEAQRTQTMLGFVERSPDV
ncbi:MAG: hypothetical protein JOZ24_11885 [Candidatus Eremiobacteraeota bacterium]|nr:hypothetical protein [Candidatus Eremiobacteraeota bacterium]